MPTTSPRQPGADELAGFVPVPWLGTTWVARGPDYRRRRALALLVMGLGTLLVCGMSFGFAYGVWSALGTIGHLVLLAYVAAGLAWGATFGWRVAASLTPQAPRFPVLVLPFVFPFSCGALLAVVVAWCLPVVPAERAAQQASGHAWKQWSHHHHHHQQQQPKQEQP